MLLAGGRCGLPLRIGCGGGIDAGAVEDSIGTLCSIDSSFEVLGEVSTGTSVLDSSSTVISTLVSITEAAGVGSEDNAPGLRFDGI